MSKISISTRDDPARQRSVFWLAIGILLLAVLLAALAIWFAPPLESLPFQLKNKDFANYWMAGRLILEDRVMILFGSNDVYYRALQAVFGPDYPPHNWSYPPHALLALWPLGLTGYLPAMALFLGVTLALYLLSLGTLRPDWSLMSVLLLLPFLVTNLVATQNGFLTAALMLSGLALRDRRPVLAGILIGILTFKPQLGLLLPVLLLVERRWIVLLSASMSAILLAGLSLLLFGMDSWIGYATEVARYQTVIMNTFGGDFPHMMASAFGSGRSLGWTADQAMLLQLPFAVAGIALFGLALWRLTDLHARSFALLLSSFLIVPYSVAYDLGALAAYAALWPISRQGRPEPPLPLRLVLMLLALLPVIMLPLGKAGLPAAPIVILAALLALLANQGAFSFTTRNPPRPSAAPQG